MEQPPTSREGVPNVAVLDQQRLEAQLRLATEQAEQLQSRILELESASSQLEAYAGDLSRTYTELRRHVQHMTVLHEVNTRIASALDPEVVIENMLDSLGQLVTYQSAAVYLSRLAVAVQMGGHSTVVSSNATPRLEARRVSDGASDEDEAPPDTAPGRSGVVEAMRLHQTTAREYERGVELAVPLQAGGSTFGALELRRLEALSEDEQRLVELLAAGAAVSLQNAYLYQETQRLATTDPLTGLSNYRHFQEQLQVEVQRARRQAYGLGLLMLDLDHFKQVNDLHGHPVGDTALRNLAQVLRALLRRTDVVGRLGGEEFGIILPDVTAQQIAVVAEKVRAGVEALPAIRNEETGAVTPLTVSVGGASMAGGDADGQLMLNRADKALYAAKHGGRNRVYLWDEEAEDARPNGSRT